MQSRLTVPSPEVVETLDERRYQQPAPTVRSEAQRDRDRILYSSALLRLGHVTQVAAPEVGHIFHSRLTHSLKVAQVARRSAERLEMLKDNDVLTGAAAELVNALSVDAAEAAALAHDIGHPPFGHLAEQVLAEKANDYGSFEGNAQSFRIVTRLAVRAVDAPGLNLTRRTLNGLLKYPWPRGAGHTKWGVYDVDREYFDWAREGLPEEERTLEAEIMDWADDVTYAVHDMDDFYRAGLVPLERLCQPGEELTRFEEYLRQAAPKRAAELTQAAERLFLGFLSIKTTYRGRSEERANLRKVGSWLITRYIEAIQLHNADENGIVVLEIDEARREEVDVLKLLTWYYIIERPSLATIQRGQREAIGALFEMYVKATEGEDPELRLFPPAFAERLPAGASAAARVRVVVDMIAGMTEASAMELYRRAAGVSSGSLLASATGPA